MQTIVATKRAVGYFRVSTATQAADGHGSLQTQEARFREYCQRHNVLPVATYTDIETGRRDDRQEYRRMVEYVLDDGADEIVVQFLDRFGRNPKEILRRYWDLEEHGVAVVATDEDIKEELSLLIKAHIAGVESRRNSERVRAYMGKAISRGVHVGRPPYGFRPVKSIEEGKVSITWEVDPQEASLVREMWRLSVEQNLGFKAIGDRLTEMGYHGRGGRPLAAFTIERILTNPALTGTLVYGRRPKKGNPKPDVVEMSGFFPAILSAGEWQRLQERLTIRSEMSRGRGHASTYLLSGIVRCGQCGGPMVGKTGALRKGKRYRNYYCSRAMRSRALCSTYNGHSARRLEEAILEYLGQFSDPELVKQKLIALEKQELERMEAELSNIEKRLVELDSQLLRDVDRLDKGILTEAEFARVSHVRRSDIAVLNARKADLSAKLGEEHRKGSQIERMPVAIRSFLQDFQEIDIRQQKAQLQTILKAAYVYRDGRIELEFRG